MCADRRESGFTLLELVVTLVILGIAFAAIAGLVATLGGGSASPVLQTQALYIAEGYLEEAMLKAYADPDPLPTPPEDCALGRDRWDDVTDYGRCLGTAASPTDSTGVAIAGLSRYRVRMTVGDPATVGGATTRRVEVQVSNVDGDFDVRIAALRAQY